MAARKDGACRLCWVQARRLRVPNHRSDVAAARTGQQLFLGGLDRRIRLMVPPERRRTRPPQSRPAAARLPVPVAHRQLVLLELPRDLHRLRHHNVPAPPDQPLAVALDDLTQEHGQRRGWSSDTTWKVRRALRLLLVLQDTPGAPIPASDVEALRPLGLSVARTVEVLRLAGFLDDDRTPTLIAWFARKTAELPGPMADELRVWLEVMRLGSATPPRFRPRPENTIRSHLTAALPALRTWAAAHQSLREISRADVLAVLPASGTRRVNCLQGLRSIFRVLKARGLVFTNPTARLRSGMPQARTPLPVDLAPLRAAVNAADPARAALAALLAYHALRSAQLRGLRLTDLRDGRLHLDGRTILLAPTVRAQLGAYLDRRQHRWPNTANPHVFINRITANTAGSVSEFWLAKTLGLSAQAIREGRILDEVNATAGDVRRLCDLFGLSVGAALRYTSTLDPPGVGESKPRQEEDPPRLFG